MGSFVLFHISILCENISTCFTLQYQHWCFLMCFLNLWFYVYIISQNLQSYFLNSILSIWVILRWLRYLLCVLQHISQLISSLAGVNKKLLAWYFHFPHVSHYHHWCFFMCFLNLWFYVHIISQKLQSCFLNSNLSIWVILSILSL